MEAIMEEGQSVLDLGCQIIAESDALEAELTNLDSLTADEGKSLYEKYRPVFEKIQELFDAYAIAAIAISVSSAELVQQNEDVSLCYGRFHDFWKRLCDICEDHPDRQEASDDSDAPDEEEVLQEVPLDEVPEEEGQPAQMEDDTDTGRKKGKKKHPAAQNQNREDAEQQQFYRTAYASIYGSYPSEDRLFSEADIRAAEYRRRLDRQKREQQAADIRRSKQQHIEAYQEFRGQSKVFDRPAGHYDLSFSQHNSPREPETPAHQENPVEHVKSTNPQPTKAVSQADKREKPHPQERLEVAAAMGLPVETVAHMSASEFRFWQNRMNRVKGIPNRNYDLEPSEPHSRKTADSFRTHPPNGAKPKLTVDGVGKTEPAFGSRPMPFHSTKRKDRIDGEDGIEHKSAFKLSSRYTLKQIQDVLIIGGEKVGSVTYRFGRNIVHSAYHRYEGQILQTNDALRGISQGSYYLGTAANVARAAINRAPAKTLLHSPTSIGASYEAARHSAFVRREYNRFKHNRHLDAKLYSMLLQKDKRVPKSAVELQKRTMEIQKTIRDAKRKKYGQQMDRSERSLTSEAKSLKEQGAAMKARVKELQSRRILTAEEKKELLTLRVKLKTTGKEVAKLTGANRAKQDIAYVGKRMQGIHNTAIRNQQAFRSVRHMALGFLMRPLASSDSNTEGLYHGYRIATGPMARIVSKGGYHAARWVIRRPMWVAKKVAPKTYETVAHAASTAAKEVSATTHAVITAPKKLAAHAVKDAAKGVAKATPKGIKTGIKRVRSVFATAKTGVHNAVYRAGTWAADTTVGHVFTSSCVAAQWAAKTLKAVWTVVKGIGVKAGIVIALILLVFGLMTVAFPMVMTAPAGGVIMSPEQSSRGKINLGPYCMAYGAESQRFDAEVRALVTKYSDTEKYDSVEVNYSGVSSNAREILSMMAVRLQQALDVKDNPEVKSYIRYMFRASHVYSVYESKYWCEGCEERPTGETMQKTVVEDGQTVTKEVPVMENYCPGHIDVDIEVKVYDFDAIYGRDNYPSADDWAGWTSANRDWCQMIYNMDWAELYEGLEYLSSGMISGLTASVHEQRVWDFLVDLIGNEYGAAGLMGNLYCESGLDPTNLQDTYEPILGYNNDSYTSAVDAGLYMESEFVNDQAGYGLAQWTWHTRKQALYSYCKSRGLSIGSIEGQLGYLGRELAGSFSGCLSALRSAQSVEEASRIAMLRFEAPLDQSESAIAVRQRYAEYYYNKMVYGVAAEGNLTQAQQRVVQIAMNSAAYGIAANAGYCQAWAAYVYGKAGFPIDTSGSAYISGTRYGVSSDFSCVPPGAAVYGYSGSKYGHVGIYVGNGQVYHNIGGVAVDTLENWVSAYRGFAWGWEAGTDLTACD